MEQTIIIPHWPARKNQSRTAAIAQPINTVNGEVKSLDVILPLAQEYRAAIIGLCMDDNGFPAMPEERIAIAEKIITRVTGLGIPVEDIIIDPLAMAMSAGHKAGRVTLETTRLVAREIGVNITMGASNISFGLPEKVDKPSAKWQDVFGG